MAQSADRVGRNKRHREDEDDLVGGDPGGGSSSSRAPGGTLTDYDFAGTKRRAIGASGGPPSNNGRRSDSASTWRKRQRKGSLGSGGRYHSAVGVPGQHGAFEEPIGGGGGDIEMQDGRKDLMNRPPPPVNDDDLSDVRSGYHRGGMFSPAQGRPPMTQRMFPVPHSSSREPSPMNHRDPPPTIMPAGVPPTAGGRPGEYYGMTPVQARSAPANSRPPIDDSARVLHSSRSAVMNAIATIGLPFLQYELTATEARFPPPEEGHLFAILALDISNRRAAQKAHAAVARATAIKDNSSSSNSNGQQKQSIDDDEGGGMKDPSAAVVPKSDPSNLNSPRHRFVLKQRSLAARKADVLEFLARHTTMSSDSNDENNNIKMPQIFTPCPYQTRQNSS